MDLLDLPVYENEESVKTVAEKQLQTITSKCMWLHEGNNGYGTLRQLARNISHLESKHAIVLSVEYVTSG